MADLEARIDDLWDHRDELQAGDEDATAVVLEAVRLLDRGEARIAEIDPVTDEVVVHQWLKRAILLLFGQSRMDTVELGPFEFADKIPLKGGWQEAGVRVVPGASARFGSFLERGVILMPSYVNIGARVGAGTMVDTWATVGSCAQIGANVHLSGGVGIGGVLEPPQAAPTFVGTRPTSAAAASSPRGRAWARARCSGPAPSSPPPSPCSTPRPAPSSGAGWSRRGAWPSPPPDPASSQAAPSGCPACSSSSGSTRASATTSRA
jgi:2,3,4,5-tetrahydropyridine-2-carboxylate N-succinyltransferase